MLALTPMPLQTAGERAFFAELARWDTGGAVRAAVVASIPVVTDGHLQRRLADAVLIVPEGIAVVRVVEVERQSGHVTVKPEGAWTIAPGPGPGEVLQLGGGGSTPLDGLMRAGMDAAVRLRRAGLEPGRIARLTVLVGNLTGLEPADGDLGEGDQVALLEPRSLLLGIARASRYAGIDNPRLWTTADVRAALEALGLQGRGPSVEELNGEGFPYSPYVLRRPELLTPAAMTAASTAAPEQAAPAAQVPAQAPAPQPAPQPVMAAAHPTTTQPAVVQPGGPRYGADPFAGVPVRDTVAVGSAPADDTDGIGGLFASAEPVDPPARDLPEVPPAGPRTAVLDQPQWNAPPAVHQTSAAQQWNAPPSSPPWAATESAPHWGAAPVSPEAGSSSGSPAGKRGALLVAAALLVLVLVGVGGFLLLRGATHHGSTATASSSAGVSHGAAPALAPGHTQQLDGATFTLAAARTDTSCIKHSYGQVAAFFAGEDCTGLSRALYTTQVGGHGMVVAIEKVRMPDATSARALKAMTDRNGTGNVSDLLREGVRFPGGPAALVDSEYASDPNGAEVTIVETSWIDPASAGTAAQLDSAASSGVVLDLPAFPKN